VEAFEGYPSAPAARDRWILARRPPRNILDPRRPYHFLVEPEPGPDGELVDVATIFLTNRECPWRCLMCDLWRNTLEETVPDGAIAAQIRHALGRLPSVVPGRSAIKLYNSGSFFDPRAIPPSEYPAIAEIVSPFSRVILECHPALIGPRCLEFRRLLPGRLELAMGLETAHPEILGRLNKRMSLDQFRRAADLLADAGIDLRTFILVRPPWLSEAEGIEWAKRSLDFAFDCRATACSLIPTRAGNGAMEALMARGEFAPPSLSAVEKAFEYGLGRRAGRVFVDLWDIEPTIRCKACRRQRLERLQQMNLTQRIPPGIACSTCPSAPGG
jgi:radical SAM enzyme (TIGR01210 family)